MSLLTIAQIPRWFVRWIERRVITEDIRRLVERNSR